VVLLAGAALILALSVANTNSGVTDFRPGRPIPAAASSKH
jgi:hypothetical protein